MRLINQEKEKVYESPYSRYSTSSTFRSLPNEINIQDMIPSKTAPKISPKTEVLSIIYILKRKQSHDQRMHFKYFPEMDKNKSPKERQGIPKQPQHQKTSLISSPKPQIFAETTRYLILSLCHLTLSQKFDESTSPLSLVSNTVHLTHSSFLPSFHSPGCSAPCIISKKAPCTNSKTPFFSNFY